MGIIVNANCIIPKNERSEFFVYDKMRKVLLILDSETTIAKKVPFPLSLFWRLCNIASYKNVSSMKMKCSRSYMLIFVKIGELFTCNWSHSFLWKINKFQCCCEAAIEAEGFAQWHICHCAKPSVIRYTKCFYHYQCCAAIPELSILQ